MPKNAPSGPQDALFEHPRGAFMKASHMFEPRAPRRRQETSQTPQKSSKRAPRWPPTSPKMTPSWPQVASSHNNTSIRLGINAGWAGADTRSVNNLN
eukprot:2905773-Pyramimonas_sp.AAC.1